MNKILGILLAFLAVTAQAQSVMDKQPTEVSTIQMTNESKVFIAGVCKFGMQFIIATKSASSSASSSGVELVQVMKPGRYDTSPAQPMPCQDKWQGPN